MNSDMFVMADSSLVFIEYGTDAYNNVIVRMETQTYYPKNYNWYMRLKRNGVTIGTRSGYISDESSSTRTFTDVMSSSEPLTIEVVFSDAHGSEGVYKSDNFYMN